MRKLPDCFIFFNFFFCGGTGSVRLPEGPGSTQDVPFGGRAARHRKRVFGDGRARHHSPRERHECAKWQRRQVRRTL